MENKKKSKSPILFFSGHKYFSNFASYSIKWKGKLYPTSEHAYQAEKFKDKSLKIKIRLARSAYLAKKVADENKDKVPKNWYSSGLAVKIMEKVIKEKILQHEHIQRKLKESGNRKIIESSPFDSFWGWGPKKNGKNNLGKIWMKLREDLLDNKLK